MQLDTDLLKKMANENLENRIISSFQPEQPPNIGRLMKFMSELFKVRPPESINCKLVVISTSKNIDHSFGYVCHRQEFFSRLSEDACVILLSDSQCLLCDPQGLKTFIEGSVVYKFENQVETLWANGQQVEITNPRPYALSVFAEPTFRELDAAIREYYEKNARHSVCPTITECWLDSKRLAFKPSPEHSLRDSLWLYLRNVMRAADVKREQVVDDSHPVDIKVTWTWSSTARALIEIKWLGKSFDEQTSRMTKEFSKVRAVDGATQLRDYIITSKIEEPDLHFIGYLVVFDARRRGISDSSRHYTGNPSKEEANYYRLQEIDFPQELILDQTLRLSYRLYLEPNIA